MTTPIQGGNPPTAGAPDWSPTITVGSIGMNGTTVTGGGGDSFANALEGSQRDAYVALQAEFASFGLSTLAPKIFDYVKQGYSSDTISLLLQQTAEYQHRFAGNAARLKAGLAVLTPAQYLATEAAYRQVLQAAGLPKGFYDQHSDFVDWIGKDVSPTEIKERADQAASVVQGTPELREAIRQMYGAVSEGDVAAYFLDQNRAEPMLQKQLAAAEFNAAALQRGFGQSANAERFAAQGITAAMAQQGYGQIAQDFQPMQRLAAIYGTSWTQGEAEDAVFTPGALTGQQQGPATESAAQKQRRLASQERAAFATQSGASFHSLEQRSIGAA